MNSSTDFLSSLFITFCSISCSFANQSDQSFTFESFGIRGGTATGGQDLENLEAVARWITPWSFDLGAEFNLNILIEASAGILDGTTETEGVFTLRPAGRISYKEWPVSLYFASGPTLLTGHRFRDFDLGGNFQFTSGLGVDFHLSEKWEIGYRFQHTSNAGIDAPNPGLDSHTLAIMFYY